LRRSLKIFLIAAVALVALSAVAFAFAYSQNASITNVNMEQMGMNGRWTYVGSHNATILFNQTGPCQRGFMAGFRGNGLGMNGAFLQNATLGSVQGTVVSQVNGILILNTGSSEVRVILPAKWTVGTDVVKRASLFNGTFASGGQNVTLKVLESNVFSNANFSLNQMLGYEATNATGTTAYAVLPFNIEPSS
jgi:hypothetical protein